MTPRRRIDLHPPITKEEMTDAICETLRRNNLTDAYIRPIITRGIGDLGLDPRKCPKVLSRHHCSLLGRNVRRPVRERSQGSHGLRAP